MVLVADDDPDFAASLEPILTQHGYRVEIASTGEEALAKASADGRQLPRARSLHADAHPASRSICKLKEAGRRAADDLRHRLPGRAHQRRVGAALPISGVLMKPFDPERPAARDRARRRRSPARTPPKHRHGRSGSKRSDAAAPDRRRRSGVRRIDRRHPGSGRLRTDHRRPRRRRRRSRCSATTPPVAMLDMRLGGSSGVELLAQLKAERPDLICVMMTAHADTQTAIAALRRGAYDYFDKSSRSRRAARRARPLLRDAAISKTRTAPPTRRCASPRKAPKRRTAPSRNSSPISATSCARRSTPSSASPS